MAQDVGIEQRQSVVLHENPAQLVQSLERVRHQTTQPIAVQKPQKSTMTSSIPPPLFVDLAHP